MKRIVLLGLCIINFMACVAQTYTDQMYATDIEFDEIEELYYFDVYLKGSTIYYTGYGIDIKLPQGIEGVDEDGAPFAVMLDADYVDEPIYPKSSRKYTHFISSAFPDAEDKTHIRVGCMSNKSQDLLETSGPLFRVYIDINCSKKTWPVGEIKLYGQQLVENIEGQIQPILYRPDDFNKLVLMYEGESNLDLRVSSTLHWSTCILPFSSSIPEGVTAYTCDSHDDEYLYLTESESMESFTPYILYSENGYEGTLIGNADANSFPENGYVKANYLNGAIIPQSVTSGYVMQNLSEGVKFYPIAENSTFTIPAGKCWVTMPEAGVKSLGFAIADETAITTAESKRMESEEIYTLQGVKVTKMLPGNIYIKGGKTVLKR